MMAALIHSSHNFTDFAIYKLSNPSVYRHASCDRREHSRQITSMHHLLLKFTGDPLMSEKSTELALRIWIGNNLTTKTTPTTVKHARLQAEHFAYHMSTLSPVTRRSVNTSPANITQSSIQILIQLTLVQCTSRVATGCTSPWALN